ncbi:MAG: (Fe-S)-binding protein [Gammaproteobacteria bacterium]|nr:MAG: (Fe-S)-binding protein [Gammaproteobacteria bacterium]
MNAIGTISYVVLALLLCAAAVGLVLGLRVQWRRIAAGQPAPGQSGAIAGLAARIHWPSFWTRGLLLSRLFKRPVAGLAHALLFFGALVAIAGHALYALTFLGIEVYEGAFGFIVMELARELAGLAMLAGAAFLFVRRLWPPERLTVGQERRGFAPMEALLLAIIVLGFAAEIFRLAQPDAVSRGEFLGLALGGALNGLEAATLAAGQSVLWWLHGLLGLAFIVLIPRTPMSHMILGPLNTALARRRAGITLPLIDFEAPAADGAEPPLGAEKLADLPRKNLLDAAACLWCGRCHEACPAAQTGKALSPKKVMLTCAAYLEQGRTQDAALIDELGAEAIFNCTTCAACVEQCPVTNNPAETILHFRRQFVMGRSEMPEVMALANRNLEARGHPFAGTAANRDDWRRGLEVPLYEAGRTEYLLWIGCAVAFEERAQQVARAMARILDAAGVSWGILEESRCTGDPARMMGNELLFVELAQANIEDFRERGISKVITMCAHCFNSFDRYYPELGASWETIPHGVLIERLIREGRLAPVRDPARRITFHDPCYLARHNGIVRETRGVVAAVGELVEMPRHGRDSFCCGAGGGNYWSREGGTARISDTRLDEALATGADQVATSCPFCLLMLTSSAAGRGGERKVFDLAELVVAALPPADATASNHSH